MSEGLLATMMKNTKLKEAEYDKDVLLVQTVTARWKYHEEGVRDVDELVAAAAESIEDDVTDEEMLTDLIHMIRGVLDQAGPPVPTGHLFRMWNGQWCTLVSVSHPCLLVPLRSTLHNLCKLIIHTESLLPPFDGWLTSHGLWHRCVEAPFQWIWRLQRFFLMSTRHGVFFTFDGWLMFDGLQYKSLFDDTSNAWKLVSVQVQNDDGDQSEIGDSRVQPVTRCCCPLKHTISSLAWRTLCAACMFLSWVLWVVNWIWLSLVRCCSCSWPSPLSAPLRRYWAIFLAPPILIDWRPSWRSSGLMTRFFLRAARHPVDPDGRPTAFAQVLATRLNVPWYPYHSGPALHCRAPSRSERFLLSWSDRHFFVVSTATRVACFLNGVVVLSCLCCSSTCMDSSLRHALALRNRGSVGFRSCFAFGFALAFSLSPWQSGLLPLEPFSPPFFPSSPLPLVHSSAPSPRCHVPDPFGPFLSAPLPALYPFQAIAHTSSYDMSLLVCESLCVIFASCVPTFPRPCGAVPLSAIISLMLVSSFSMISSNLLGPVRNSRLVCCTLDTLRPHLITRSCRTCPQLFVSCVLRGTQRTLTGVQPLVPRYWPRDQRYHGIRTTLGQHCTAECRLALRDVYIAPNWADLTLDETWSTLFRSRSACLVEFWFFIWSVVFPRQVSLWLLTFGFVDLFWRKKYFNHWSKKDQAREFRSCIQKNNFSFCWAVWDWGLFLSHPTYWHKRVTPEYA